MEESQLCLVNLLALFGIMPGGIVAEEELAVEELHTHHGKDEEK
jgi:hypothetical protein